MEQEVQTSRKELIKKIAVIFLVVLLVLTFFSNTIMNYSLPEVATEPVTSGTVSNKVRGQGTVETNSDYEVTVSGTRVIKEVKVQAGDTVEKGQVLFTFEEAENTELNDAEDALEQMELDYAKSLLTSGPDYTSDNNNIKDAKEDLEAAIKAQEKAKGNDKKLKTAKSQEEKLKTQVSSQQKTVNELQEKVEEYGEVGDYESAQAKVESISNELALLRVQLTELRQQDDGSDPEITQSIHNKELEINIRESDLKAAQKEAENLKKIGGDYTKLKTDLKAANKKLTELQEALTKKSEEVTELSGVMSLADAKADVKMKQKALTDLLLALKTRKKEDSLSQQSASLDMQAAEKKIEEQRELVKKLKSGSDLKEIKSKEAGVVSQVDFKVGDSVTADTPLAKIQLADSGYVAKITVTKEQAKLIKTDDEATIENVWDNDLKATVKSIKADPENPNQNMIVTFEVKGNVNVGQNLAFSVGERSNRYDAVVPNNAVKEDSKGKFVLVVTVKGTPLGNRYKVKRADVEVLASDDTSSGVSGGVYEYDNVVTNSSKPLEEGDQVRLKE
ncbi:MAG: HlyD family efflux transporter periplasmic adaptor subunit [Lachnospiraceae bacterium]|nr:HlyD family efflux transporter periplasmic adaptor subunit [Lachnospiraceae bacterium]